MDPPDRADSTNVAADGEIAVAERSSGLDRPGDRNARRAMAGVVSRSLLVCHERNHAARAGATIGFGWRGVNAERSRK
jgi:hypothetical protein